MGGLFSGLKKLKLKNIVRGVGKVAGAVGKALPIVGSAVEAVSEITKGKSKVVIEKKPEKSSVIGRAIVQAAQNHIKPVQSSPPASGGLTLASVTQGNGPMLLIGGGLILYLFLRKGR